jgi:hypothetical protein
MRLMTNNSKQTAIEQSGKCIDTLQIITSKEVFGDPAILSPRISLKGMPASVLHHDSQ